MSLGLPRRVALRVSVACAMGFVALTASAQAPDRARRDNDCVLDRCGDRNPAPRPSTTQDRAAPSREATPSREAPASRDPQSRPVGTSIAPGRFDFYVLALSWSPSFCMNSDRKTAQCDVGAKNAFVLHGLWPQFERGFPSDCDSRAPSAIAMQAARGVWPDDGLARYEWRKHGTCSGKPAQEYFADAKRAKESVEIPDELVAPKRQLSMSPNEIQRAFMDANPRLRAGMMAVQCQRGVLQEVRVCLSKDLRDFRACPDVVRAGCRTQNISVPPVR